MRLSYLIGKFILTFKKKKNIFNQAPDNSINQNEVAN